MFCLLKLKIYCVYLIVTMSLISTTFATVQSPQHSENRLIRNGIIDPKSRWKKFYVFVDPEFDDDERKIIEIGVAELKEALPCVKFHVWSKGKSPSGFKKSFVHVVKSKDGCSSHVGRKSKGSQKLELGPKCFSLKTVIHEMIHALGFHHEQSQPDRDEYVDILWGNIEKDKRFNFKKYSTKEVSTFGVAYNPKSIMHYSSRAFSKNEMPTILTKNGEVIARPMTLARSDITKLTRMYKC